MQDVFQAQLYKMARPKTLILFILFLLFVSLEARAQLIYESGGKLLPEQAAYNVHHYELDLRINPSDSTVAGRAWIRAILLKPVESIIVDLHPDLVIEQILSDNKRDTDHGKSQLAFKRESESKRNHVSLPEWVQPGDHFELEIHYHGKPVIAENPPWEGGFVWARTPDGQPWIGVTGQTSGAWTWWPHKDHPSDKPDSVTMRFTLPEELVVASNGILRATRMEEDGWKSWEWFSPAPISPYNVTFNAAPYQTIKGNYRSVTGTKVPLRFWVLPDRFEDAERLFSQISRQLHFLEELLGPYPFRHQKYGVAHAPYLGMEHQTLIAYGADFRDNNLFGVQVGFDDLHHHELAHEWWGNLVTAADWNDFWIHEGFSTYMQALYAEELGGGVAYRCMMNRFRGQITSVAPLAPRNSMTTREIYDSGAGADLYYKGAWFLHTLRYRLGDELFFQTLRRFLYPYPEMELQSAPPPVRLVTTDDYLELVNDLAGDDLSGLFETYLRSAPLPLLVIERTADRMLLRWERVTEAFDLSVEVELDGERKRLRSHDGKIMLEIPMGVNVKVDPDRRILMEILERGALDRPEK